MAYPFAVPFAAGAMSTSAAPDPADREASACCAQAVTQPLAGLQPPLCPDLSALPLPAGVTASAAPWMTAEAWLAWAAEVSGRVSPARWGHVQRVALLAAQIAYAARLDTRRAYAAGILHDAARELTSVELLLLAPPQCDLDARWPLAVHGRAARALLEGLGFADEPVLEAVEDHVTGPRPGHALAACVYIADVSEPGRGVNDEVRALALHDLPAALRLAVQSKVHYLQGRGIEVHPQTLRLYHWLQEQESGAAGGPPA